MASSTVGREVDWLCRPADEAAPTPFRQIVRHASFEIFCTERVSLTSTLYSGGDWRWRFRSAAGTILVNSEGYTSERSCRAAVTALQDHAGSAMAPKIARI